MSLVLPDVPLTRDLRASVRRYLESVWQGGSAPVQRCDVILALLRVGTADARSAAEQIVGRPITTCPPAVPPRRPLPVARQSEVPRVRRVDRDPPVMASSARERFGLIKVGMTVDQMLSRGVTRRDIRYWTKKGYLEVRP